MTRTRNGCQGTDAALSVESITFGPVVVRFGPTVLRPRPWTLAQSAWAEELLGVVPEGAVLELCTGAGQIGLALAARTSRRVVLVDADPSACAFARANAAANGLSDRVEVRNTTIREVTEAAEHFALILADPPWVPTAETARYPDDPLHAIDGGDVGLGVAYDCVAAMNSCLLDDGAGVIQLGDVRQARRLDAHLRRNQQRLAVVETRQPNANGVLARLARNPPLTEPS